MHRGIDSASHVAAIVRQILAPPVALVSPIRTTYRVVRALPAGATVITHNLERVAVIVQIRDHISGVEIAVRVTDETLTTITLRLPTARANVRITVI